MTKLNKLTIIITTALLLVVVATGASLANVIYVWPDSQGSGLDGTSWAKAFRTIQAGLNAAATGDQVWVAADMYMERITLKKGVALYGGFPAGSGVWESRDPARNETIIDATLSGTAVTVPSAASLDTVIDGFTIKNGKAASGGGINCTSSSATITNNKIMLNTVTSYGAGVFCSSSTIDMRNNVIQSNTASNGGGIYLNYALGTVANNVITKNTATGAAGGGIVCGNSSAVIVNNTVAYNQSATRGGGINCVYYYGSLSNNIVAFNSTGIFNQSGTPALRNNCVYNPSGANYTGISAGTGDISVDPEFVNASIMNYHILETSPCINAGYDNVVLADWVDIDGRPRLSGEHVDIGADEITINISLAEAKRSPDGESVSVATTVVTASFPGYFYVETTDRTCGMRVERINHTVGVGNKVNLFGKVYSNTNSEKYIEAVDITPAGAGYIFPLNMISRNVGGGDWQYDLYTGAGQRGITGTQCISSMGMLVKICGTVIERGRGWFYIDDGCRVSDGTPYTGIYVAAPDLDTPAKGQWAMVTGIASCEIYNGNLVNVLLPRSQEDIVFDSEEITIAGFLSVEYPPNPRGK